MSKDQEIKALEIELRAASDAYYMNDSSPMSDIEFDLMKRHLEDLDLDNPFLTEVGAPVNSKLTKIKHTIPMGSVDNVMSLSEYLKWVKNKISSNCIVAAQWKYDGLSIELIYKNGVFVQAITRGDGEEGEDVTHTIKNAQGFPLKLKSAIDISVRCESMLPISAYNKHFSKEMKNPRNAAAGLTRRSSAEGSEHLLLVAFDAVNGKQWDTEADRMNWLTDQGFTAADTFLMLARDVPDFAEKMEAKRASLDYLVDGMVIKVDEVRHQDKLGIHRGRPYWARAWKFAAAVEHSFIRDVKWSIGTQKTITPVACIDPTEIAGVTVSNVTLHNIDEIERLNIRIGDKVEVIRSGDVIPKIVCVVEHNGGRSIITDNCPACGGQVKRVGPVLKCNAGYCPGVQKKCIQAWIKKRGIMYLGDSAMEALFDSKTVTNIRGLYTVTKAEMVSGGVGAGMADKILAEIEKSRDVTVVDFMGSFSLDLLGRAQAKKIVQAGIDTVHKFLHQMNRNKLASMPGFGKTKSDRICDAIDSASEMIEKTLPHMRIAAPKQNSGKLLGKKFCFTGKSDLSRSELKAMCEDAGGVVASSVSKNVDYLVIADPKSTSGKANKARALGLELISEDDFVSMSS